MSDTFTTVRIKIGSHEKAREIAQYAMKNGWASLNATSDDRASISSVIAVAIECLHERLKKGPTAP